MIDPPTHRMVDGDRVELTPQEVLDTLAEWEANRIELEAKLEAEAQDAARIAARNALLDSLLGGNP